MAEILLSLTIIGVVAAITLPSLTGNINERTWNTQRKALYARFSQAMALMPSLNGYGTLSAAVEADEANGIEAKDAVDTAVETFITDGLAKVLKINNVCDSEHLADCGIPSRIIPQGDASNINLEDIKTLNGLNSNFNLATDIKAAAFETQNGESILVYYNPNCQGDLNEKNLYSSIPKMCANFIYDLNGNKGPNTVGKDIGFITALYPADPSVVAPMPLTKSISSTHIAAPEKCKIQDNESRVPNLNELTAMFYNMQLLGISSGWYCAAGTYSEIPPGAWYIPGLGLNFNDGKRGPLSAPRTNNFSLRCIKR